MPPVWLQRDPKATAESVQARLLKLEARLLCQLHRADDPLSANSKDSCLPQLMVQGRCVPLSHVHDYQVGSSKHLADPASYGSEARLVLEVF